MQITKREALSLVKVLSHYDSITAMGDHHQPVDDVFEIVQRLENYVLSVNDDDAEMFSSSFTIDSDIHPSELVDLQKVYGHVNNSSVGDSGTDVSIVFKKVINESGCTDTFAMINKEVIGPITCVSLSDRELQIATETGHDRLWHYFDLEQVPDDWSHTFGSRRYVFQVINWT